MSRFALSVLSVVVCFSNSARAEDWPAFLGPKGDGHYTGKPLPVEFGPDKNVVWKVPVAGKAWSSPIVVSGHVYLTTAVPKSVGNGTEYSLRAICLNAIDGKTEWDVEVFLEPATAPTPHSKNSHASPTPIFDGKRLYVHFGHIGTAALSPEGKILWKNAELGYKPVHGNGGSPILVDDKLVYSVDGADKQYIVALSTETGKVVWQTPRDNPKADKKFSFSTPTLIEHKGKRLIVSPASDALHAYDVKSGKELWRVPYSGYSVIPKPLYGNGMVYVSTSYNTPVVHAIRPEGIGTLPSSNIVWSQKRGGPHTPSMILDGSELYLVSDGGAFTCCDAKTGEVHYSERVPGNHSSSPIIADGKIYVLSETGQATVIKAGKEFQILAKNDMNDRTLASYAAVDGSLYVRTEKMLYRFEEK